MGGRYRNERRVDHKSSNREEGEVDIGRRCMRGG